METFGKILLAVVGLAIVAVVVSSNAQTSSVLQAFFSGFGSIIGAAVAPVSGSSSSTSATTPSFGAF